MDKFLEGHILPKLTKGEINQIGLCLFKDIELLINNFPKKKVQAQMVSLVYLTKLSNI